MDMLYLGICGSVAIVLLAWGWDASARRWRITRPGSVFPSDTQVSRKPVLSDAQARFYNLLRLAVQDRYLILAHVPLWCFLDVQLSGAKLPRPLLGQFALKRATFLLVHAGTRQAEKVVELEGEGESTAIRREHDDKWLEVVLGAAGVQLVRINAADSCTVPALASLLDADEPG